MYTGEWREHLAEQNTGTPVCGERLNIYEGLYNGTCELGSGQASTLRWLSRFYMAEILLRIDVHSYIMGRGREDIQ